MAKEALVILNTGVVWNLKLRLAERPDDKKRAPQAYLPCVEVTNGRDEEIKEFFPDFIRVQFFQGQLPLASRSVPVGTLHFRLELSLFVNTILLRDSLPVISDLISSCKLLRPVTLGLECALVYCRRHVTANAGVCVLEPLGDISRLCCQGRLSFAPCTALELLEPWNEHVWNKKFGIPHRDSSQIE